MGEEFRVDPPGVWEGSAQPSGVLVSYVLAENEEHAVMIYLAYLDAVQTGGYKAALPFVSSGTVSGTPETAQAAGLFARLEGRELTVFRIVSTKGETV